MPAALTEHVALMICAPASETGWQMTAPRVRNHGYFFKYYFPYSSYLLFSSFYAGICQFGLAHVDSPKGDLDASGGALDGPSTKVVVNDQIYPYGTTEQYPAVTDMNGNILTNTAHEYRECSNKGICDRSSGTCACFPGYEGSACQRASCPSNSNGVCSGHGTCQTIAEVAALDSNNIYRLWDADSTMGCVCDSGYEGADCSERKCKYGVDPLYMDNNATIRYSNFTYQLYTESSSATIIGNYSLVFYDAHGEDWQTEPIAWNANCATIISALEGLPNNVISSGTVRCVSFNTTGTYGQISGVDPVYTAGMYVKSKYTLTFPENPGKLKQIEINKYLDGSRPTLYTNEMQTSTLGWNIYPNGFIGEEVDMVSDRCFGVTVTLAYVSGQGTHYLDGLTSDETKLLKTCLGDSNGNPADNVEVYNWDYGNRYNPHLIKLQDATQYQPALRLNPDGLYSYDPTLVTYPYTNICPSGTTNTIGVDKNGNYLCSNANPPGFFAVLYYDPSYTSNPFRLYTRAANDFSTTTQFFVYTTTGYLQLVNPNSVVFTRRSTYTTSETVASAYTNVLGMAPAMPQVSGFNGDMSCESTPVGSYGSLACLNKNDYVMFFNARNGTESMEVNPVYPNMYTVAKIYKSDLSNSTGLPNNWADISRLGLALDYSLNSDFFYINGNITDDSAQAYKFYPPTTNADGGYRYALPCSGRGLCNSDSGQCECFKGYTLDDCSSINSLAV